MSPFEEIEHSPMEALDDDGDHRSARERHSLLPPSLGPKVDTAGLKSI